MKKQEEVLYEEVFISLNKKGVNYAVCGGFAVVLYGYSRLTVDLDLIVGLEKENLEKIYDILIKLNYKPQIPIKKKEFIEKDTLEKMAREKNMKVVSFYNTKDHFKVIDVGVNLPGIKGILDKKKKVKIKNFFIPIIEISDLIKMKEKLARPRDLTDVENLKKIKKEKGY